MLGLYVIQYLLFENNKIVREVSDIWLEAVCSWEVTRTFSPMRVFGGLS